MEYPEITKDPDNGNYNCMQCGKQFTKPGRVVQHVEKVHRREKSAECHICGKQFQYAHTLKTHMFTHTGDYPYSCNRCGRQFRDAYKLNEEHRKSKHPEDYARWPKQSMMPEDLPT